MAGDRTATEQKSWYVIEHPNSGMAAPDKAQATVQHIDDILERVGVISSQAQAKAKVRVVFCGLSCPTMACFFVEQGNSTKQATSTVTTY